MTTKDWTDLKGEDVIDSRDLIEAAQALRDELEAREPTGEELAFLREFDEVESAGIPDFPYGEALIQVEYFTAAANALKQDYIDVVLFETTYYARA